MLYIMTNECLFVCAGNGSQFLALSVFIIILAILGMFNVHR